MEQLDLSVILDTVSITGKIAASGPFCKLPGIKPQGYNPTTFEPDAMARELLRQLLPFEVETTSKGQFFELGQAKGRINYYEHSYAVHFDGDMAGHISIGGNEDRAGRESWQLYLNASACAVIGLSRNWRTVRQSIIELDARLSRVDVAADDLQGVITLDNYMTMYQGGQFDPDTGRHPTCKLVGNPFEQTKDGRTFYVGKRDGLKMCRVYEKGLQLGYEDSAWVRFEVEFKRDKETEIPIDILTRPGDYFRGAYKVTALLVKNAASYRETLKEAIKIKAEVAMQHARRSYGRWIKTVLDIKDMNPDMLFAILTDGIDQEPPRRLLSEAVQAGVIVPPVVIRGETHSALEA